MINITCMTVRRPKSGRIYFTVGQERSTKASVLAQCYAINKQQQKMFLNIHVYIFHDMICMIYTLSKYALYYMAKREAKEQ